MSVMEPKPSRSDTHPGQAPTRGERPVEPLIFEKSVPGLRGCELPPLDVPRADLPDELVGEPVALPEIGEHDVMSHYTRLSHRNFSVDANFYPLGSCTMKHNPRINEWAAALPGFAQLHPLQDDGQIQGALRLLYETRSFLEEISGFDEVSLQPAAGAHGEYTALKVIGAYFRHHGQAARRIVLTPDTAHGTNPASCAMCGGSVVSVKTADGFSDWVERIAWAYDSLSRVSTVTQYDDPTAGNVVNEVKNTYDDWGNVSKFEQDHDSTVAESGSKSGNVSKARSATSTPQDRSGSVTT